MPFPGGYFGSYLKFAGFDAIFFTGDFGCTGFIYMVEMAGPQIKKCGSLWGKDTYETEDCTDG